MLAAVLLQAPPKKEPPRQPVPYSHKQHLALGLKCQHCHANPDPGEMMGIPAAPVCMNCHRTVKTEAPAIQKLAAYARDNREAPWIRVYQVPSYVFFSHRVHREAGASCQTCHGPVEQREVLWREGDISMGGCVDCHRKNRASNDCAYCHEPR